MAPPRWLLRFSSSVHVVIYRLSGGRLGATMNGMPVLLLTTIGRKTSQPRTVPLVYMLDGAAYVIAPGVVENPAWYLNLRTNPQATIQTGASVMPAKAQEVHGEERRQLWARVPPYWRDYQRSYRGEIQVMILLVKPERR